MIRSSSLKFTVESFIFKFNLFLVLQGSLEGVSAVLSQPGVNLSILRPLLGSFTDLSLSL